MKKNVAVAIFSRANYARIKSVLTELRDNKKINLQIILGGSALLERYGNLEGILKQDRLRVSAKTSFMIEGATPETMAKSTGLAIIELATIFSNLKPNIVLTVADRFETMATAIASSYMNIILAHTQGGEVTGSIDESVRHSITKLAHIHFPATKNSYNRLIRMGELKKNVFLVGCPSIDLINKKELKFDKSFFKKFKYVGKNIDFNKKYILVQYHPVTTEYYLEKRSIEILLNSIIDLNIQTIWMWPNIDAGTDIVTKTIRRYREKNDVNNICFVKNLPPSEFLKLIYNSECFVGNSSAAIRESAYMAVPAVSIGSRQKPREHGNNVIFTAHNKNEIINAIKIQMSKKNKIKISKIFGSGNAGKKISKILERINVNIQKKITY
jgi:UDP-hydrolysing UDP-N-acetyl-D-glucosamine 2-epimerase